MDLRPNSLQHHSPVVNKPAILYTEYRAFRTCFLCDPALELMPDIPQTPKIHFPLINLDVRPSPMKAAMVLVIFGEVICENFAVESVNRMKVG